MIRGATEAEVALLRERHEAQEGCWYVRLQGNERRIGRINDDLAGPRVVRDDADDIEHIHWR